MIEGKVMEWKAGRDEEAAERAYAEGFTRAQGRKLAIKAATKE